MGGMYRNVSLMGSSCHEVCNSEHEGYKFVRDSDVGGKISCNNKRVDDCEVYAAALG